MKKILFILIFFAIFAYFSVVGAVEKIEPILKYKSIPELAEAIARYMLIIGSPIATIAILYGAFLFMTSGGSEEKVKKAKKTLTWAVIGLTILIINYGIANLIEEIIQKGG